MPAREELYKSRPALTTNQVKFILHLLAVSCWWVVMMGVLCGSQAQYSLMSYSAQCPGRGDTFPHLSYEQNREPIFYSHLYSLYCQYPDFYNNSVLSGRKVEALKKLIKVMSFSDRISRIGDLTKKTNTQIATAPLRAVETIACQLVSLK